MITGFLDIDSYLFKFVNLSKSLRESALSQQAITDLYWKNAFAYEFCHAPDQFPDFLKNSSESNFDAFKRAFQLYKELRKLVWDMIVGTARNLKKDLESEDGLNLLAYFSPFEPEKRQVHHVIKA